MAKEPFRAKIAGFFKEYPWTAWTGLVVLLGMIVLTVLFLPVMAWVWFGIGVLGGFALVITVIAMIVMEWAGDFY